MAAHVIGLLCDLLHQAVQSPVDIDDLRIELFTVGHLYIDQDFVTDQLP